MVVLLELGVIFGFFIGITILLTASFGFWGNMPWFDVFRTAEEKQQVREAKQRKSRR